LLSLLKRRIAILCFISALALGSVIGLQFAGASSSSGAGQFSDVYAGQVIKQIIDYTHAVQMTKAVEYVGAVDQANLKAYVAAVTPPPPAPERYSAPTPSAAPSGGGGDCYSGSPVPDWIINRESGGNPNAVNPSSGAYGCYQELPGHFNNGAVCSGLSMYSVDDQKVCAQRLIDASGGSLAPWAL
jgi:hypothetical protein